MRLRRFHVRTGRGTITIRRISRAAAGVVAAGTGRGAECRRSAGVGDAACVQWDCGLAGRTDFHAWVEGCSNRVAERKTVTVGAGIRYGDLAVMLDGKGLALHNLASLPHISVGGACATATHGSGMRNGNLATAVVGMKFVGADGAVAWAFRGIRMGSGFARGAWWGLGRCWGCDAPDARRCSLGTR